MTTADILGSFLWHDLMTTDPGAAGDFYPKVLGWKSEAVEGTDYKVWTTPQGMSGGASQLESDSKAPSHWLAYVGTPDIEATIDKAKELGGSLVKEVKDMASVGKYAVIADPQGALIALYSPESAEESTDTGASFSWHELATSDPEAAWDFYSELFGWSKEGEHDMGPMGIYLLFGQDGKQLGGIYKLPPDRPSAPSWLSYVSVPSAADAAEAAKDAGGQVANGPMEVPGGDLIAQLIDPQGAFFAVHQVKQKAAKAKKPKKSAAPKRETAQTEPVASEDMANAAEETESEEPAPKKKKAASKSNGASAAPATATKTKASAKSKAPAKSKAAAKSKASVKTKAATKTQAAAKSKAPAAKKSAGKAAVKKTAAKKSAGKKAAVKKGAASKAAPKKAAAKKSAPVKKKASKKKATKKK